MGKRMWIFLAVVVVGFGVFVWWQKGSDANKQATVQPSEHIYGKADSKVRLVEYLDFQCEACYKYFPLVRAVKEKYKDKIAFQARNLPGAGHQWARAAHAAAEAASRQGKYWEMHDVLFMNQKTWEQDKNPPKVFEGYAERLGLNIEQYKADLTNPEISAVINADVKAGRELGAKGTPTFVLNGRVLTGIDADDLDAFSKIIDDELQKVGQQ